MTGACHPFLVPTEHLNDNVAKYPRLLLFMIFSNNKFLITLEKGREVEGRGEEDVGREVRKSEKEE